MFPTEEQLEVLKELINIGVGRGASVLNSMIRTHIELQIPDLGILSFDDLILEIEKIAPGELALVELGFREGSFTGSTQLIFPSEVASKLIYIMTGVEDEEGDFNSLRSGAFLEVGNIVLNSVVGSFSNVLSMHLNYSVPNYLEGDLNGVMKSNMNRESTGEIILAKTRFLLKEQNIHGIFALFFEMKGFEHLLGAIDNLMIGAEPQGSEDGCQATVDRGPMTVNGEGVVAG